MIISHSAVLQNIHSPSTPTLVPHRPLPFKTLDLFEYRFELWRYRISILDIERQLWQQLARFNAHQLHSENTVSSELGRVVQTLVERRKDIPREFLGAEYPQPIQLQYTTLELVPHITASDIHRSLHYLGSPRSSGIHLGLFAAGGDRNAGRLLSLVTLSSFDLEHLSNSMFPGYRCTEVLVVSRIVTMDGSPRNTGSYALGRAFDWVRKNLPEVKCLVTYCNPNLAFSGALYKATNWVLIGFEHKRRNLYVDGYYVTDREIIKRYGTANFLLLRRMIGDRITRSVTPLKSLEVYAYFLWNRGSPRKAFATRDVVPPEDLVGV